MSALDLSLGCIFIGVMLNIWLYGFTCVQTYIYFIRFKSDRQAMQVFVTFLFAADTINSVLDAVFLYKYLVTNYGNIAYAMRSNDEFATDPLCVSVIGFATQLFFAWRIWRLLPGRYSWIPPLVIFLLGLMSFLGALGTTIGVVIIRTFAEFQKFEQAVIVWLACTAAADVVVTVSLIVTLHRARTGFSKTDNIITRLIRNTLQTGLLTSSFAVIDLVLFLCSTTTLHLVFNLPLSKLYVNSLLSTLNARASLFQTRPQIYEATTGTHSASGTNMDSTHLKSVEAGMSCATATVSAIESEKVLSRDFSPSASTLAAASMEMEKTTTRETHSPTGTRSSGARISLDAKQAFLQPWNGSGKRANNEEGSIMSVFKRPSSAKGKPKPVVDDAGGVEIVTVEEQFRSDLPASDVELAANVTNAFYAQTNASHSSLAKQCIIAAQEATTSATEEAMQHYHAQLSPDYDVEKEGQSPTSSAFHHPYSQG